MRTHTHPGEFIKEEVLPHINLTVAGLATEMRITTRQLEDVLEGKSPLTQCMAERLAVLFENSPEFWMNMQRAHDDSARLIRADAFRL